jgi:drug/metabolite transporter (DMT)-like permease
MDRPKSCLKGSCRQDCLPHMTAEAARLRIKTLVCVVVVVLSNVFGDFFLKRGMPSDLPTPLSYITALFRPWAALGVLLLAVWLMSRMALLSWADLSYVLPVTSIGYVLVALLAKAFLHEQIGVKRWSGILLIVAGVALVSAATPPQTEQRPSPERQA